jgi:hypothetical protein
MQLKYLVAQKYKIIAKDFLKMEIEALADLMTDKDQYIIFTKTKDLKYDKDLTGGEEEILGLVGFPQSELYNPETVETLKKAKFAHLVSLVKTKFLPSDLEIDEVKAKKLLAKWAYVPSIFSGARKKEFIQKKFDFEWPRIGQKKTLSAWIRLIVDGSEGKTKAIIAMGYNAIEKYTNRVVFLDPKAYKVETVYRLELPKEQKLEKQLTPEEEDLLKEYVPDLGDHTSFRVPMPIERIEKNATKMSDDDIAWHLLTSKNASKIGDEEFVRDRFGFREICILQLMNKNITKKERTGIAEYILDKGGATMVTGPTLTKYITALAKIGAVDDKILKAGVENDMQSAIHYGKISDPDELRKLDYKKWDYQLSHNPYTPPDVLEKIVAYNSKVKGSENSESNGEIRWSGRNPNYGGVLGEDTHLYFTEAINHPNYPLDKLLAIFKKYEDKYKDNPKAINGLVSNLWTRPDLPKDIADKLVKHVNKYNPKYKPTEPPACYKDQDFMSYWSKLKKDDKFSLRLIDHPHVPSEVLKEVLNSDESQTYKTEAYNKLKERGEITDNELVSKVKKDLKFDGPDELLKQFGLQAFSGIKGEKKLKFTPVSPKDLDRIKKEMAEATTHDDFTFKVVEAYTVDQQIHKDFPKKAKEIGNLKHGLYHGTSMANAAGILASGINTKGESRTGAMFGNGFYLASSASKAAQYASDNFSKSGYGVVFKMDAALGKSAEWKYGRPEHDNFMYSPNETKKQIAEYAEKEGFKSYDTPRWHLTHDSVHAKKGLALQHDEFVVRDGQQIDIKEIIIIHKEEK